MSKFANLNVKFFYSFFYFFFIEEALSLSEKKNFEVFMYASRVEKNKSLVIRERLKLVD